MRKVLSRESAVTRCAGPGFCLCGAPGGAPPGQTAASGPHGCRSRRCHTAQIQSRQHAGAGRGPLRRPQRRAARSRWSQRSSRQRRGPGQPVTCSCRRPEEEAGSSLTGSVRTTAAAGRGWRGGRRRSCWHQVGASLSPGCCKQRLPAAVKTWLRQARVWHTAAVPDFSDNSSMPMTRSRQSHRERRSVALVGR